MTTRQHLSDKTVAVLTLIAEGYSHSQIVDGHPDITYLDILGAAEEALRLNESSSDYHERMAKIKKKHPKAYEKWTDEDDAELEAMHGEGAAITEMANHFQRQPSAIHSRLAKLGLSLPGDK